MDVAKNPPERTIQLKNSEYQLEANALADKLHTPEADYLEKATTLKTQLASLSLLQSNGLQGHIADLVEHGYPLESVKSHLKLAYGLDLSFVTTTEELRSPSTLEQLQHKLESELSALETEYFQSMNDAIEAQRKSVFEQDEKRREVLQFINNIGFDLLPKAFTDQLLSEVRSGVTQVKQLEINPANLDLANGRF